MISLGIMSQSRLHFFHDPFSFRRPLHSQAFNNLISRGVSNPEIFLCLYLLFKCLMTSKIWQSQIRYYLSLQSLLSPPPTTTTKHGNLHLLHKTSMSSYIYFLFHSLYMYQSTSSLKNSLLAPSLLFPFPPLLGIILTTS